MRRHHVEFTIETLEELAEALNVLHTVALDMSEDNIPGASQVTQILDTALTNVEKIVWSVQEVENYEE